MSPQIATPKLMYSAQLKLWHNVNWYKLYLLSLTKYYINNYQPNNVVEQKNCISKISPIKVIIPMSVPLLSHFPPPLAFISPSLSINPKTKKRAQRLEHGIIKPATRNIHKINVFCWTQNEKKNASNNTKCNTIGSTVAVYTVWCLLVDFLN